MHRFFITHGAFKRTRSESNADANVCMACPIMHGPMAACERLIFLPLSRVIRAISAVDDTQMRLGGMIDLQVLHALVNL